MKIKTIRNAVFVTIGIVLLILLSIIFGYFYFAFDYVNTSIKCANYDISELDIDENGFVQTGEKAENYYKLVLYDGENPTGYPSMKNKFSIKDMSYKSIVFNVDAQLIYRDDSLNVLSEYEKSMIIKVDLVDYHWRITFVN